MDRYITSNIDDSNYNELWDTLKKIEEKRKKDIDYEDRYCVINCESELCYEQGKLIENVEWTGSPIFDIPETIIPYCTYSRMNYSQLKYYLYWRSCFRKGESIDTGTGAFVQMCASELIAEFGPFSPKQRLEQLECLYKTFGYRLTNAHWIGEYANIHGLNVQDEAVKKRICRSNSYWNNVRKDANDDLCKIVHGDYSGAFDIICSKSTWKLKTNSFVKKTKCIKNIETVVLLILPRIEKLFADAGIVFSDFLVGRIKLVKHQIRAYEGSIWTNSVAAKFGVEATEMEGYEWVYPSGKVYFTDGEGNIKRQTNTCIHYCDPYLSEYILKYTEMLFRKELSYNVIIMPNKLSGALKVKFANGYEYILSADPELQRREKIYFSLYDDIEKIIITSFQEYITGHLSEINELKGRLAEKKVVVETVTLERKVPVDEQMVEFINKSDDSEGQVDKLIELYNKAAPSYKKSKAKKFASWMWDYWILHFNNIPYAQLNDTVLNNKWNIASIQAIQERRFADALPYLRTFYDPCAGAMSKKIDGRVIADSIIIVLICMDEICRSRGVDFVEILLGKYATCNWHIYAADESIKNTATNSVVKNIGNVQIYQFDPSKNLAVVSRHSYSQNSKDFVIYLLKSIDNSFRTLAGYNSYLNCSFDEKELDDIPGAVDALSTVGEVIAAVTKYTFHYNEPKYQESALSEDTSVSNELERNYHFKTGSEIANVTAYVENKLKEYYILSTETKLKVNRPYDALELDLNTFDIHAWIYRYKNKGRIKQEQTNAFQYKFYDLYEDALSKLVEIKNNEANYNPRFNFLASNVLKEVKGLVNKDVRALSRLCDDSSDFMQWIEWAKRGIIVYAKNEPYIQLLFCFILNDWILSDNRAACLVMMCEIWNYYFKGKLIAEAYLYLEWIKDYWMLYCSHEITYGEFKSLFVYDIEFYNENRRVIANNHFSSCIEKFGESHLLQFYNENCDYRVLEGIVVIGGYSSLLEDAIEAVHAKLKKLWAKYNLNFMDYFHDEEISMVKTREIFRYAVLTASVKERIAETTDRVIVSNEESYTCQYGAKGWPVFTYQIIEVNNTSSRTFMEYILKLTEKWVGEWLGLLCDFQFDNKKFSEDLPTRLRLNNIKGSNIELIIRNTVTRVCSNSGIKAKDPQILDPHISTATLIGDVTENGTKIKNETRRANSKYVEYDLIKMNQKVDKDSIERARRVLKKNQERLVIEDTTNEENKPEFENPEFDSEGFFTMDEQELLRALLDGGDIQKKVNELKSRFISVNLLVESINNKTIDEIGDSIIEEGEKPSLVMDYLEEVQNLLEK